MTLILRSLFTCWLVAALCFTAPLAGQSDDDWDDFEDETQFSELLACRAVDVDAKLVTGKTGRDTVEVTVDSNTEYFEHVASKLSEVLDRSVWVLGAIQAPQQVPGSTASTEQTVTRILAVVEGDRFEPPPLTETQKNSHRSWMKGKVALRKAGQYTLDGTLMQVGADRPVLRLVPRKWTDVTEGKRPLLRKGALIRVEGEKVVAEEDEDAGKKKKKREPIIVTGKRVEILTKKYAQKDYALILGTAK